MRLGGRIAAAIDILGEIQDRHRPASEALKDWGKSHRFAGSGDRHTIGTLVYDCLRKRNSLSRHMQSSEPRSLALAALKFQWRKDLPAIASAAQENHGPGALTPGEMKRLQSVWQASGTDWIDGDYPQWLSASFKRVFGDRTAAEGEAQSERAPIDLRTNTLKTTRPELIAALERFSAAPGPLSPLCIRIPAPGPEARNVNVEAEPAHGMGWFEVQDAASQVAALMSGAMPGETVADICAGAGGKTLALAAMMRNEGKLVAYDSDRHRLRPIFERLQRSGATNVEVIPASDGAKLETMSPFDCVVIDAPCSGSGAWRRKPDAKWRLSEEQLQQRIKDQRGVLELGAKLVRNGGRLIYITCSVLPEENIDQISAFCGRHLQYRLKPFAEQWHAALGSAPPQSADGATQTLLLTPASHDTDGFFVAVMEKAG
jgi:16S rRNA (cytosine967-C5)-methyltransferase